MSLSKKFSGHTASVSKGVAMRVLNFLRFHKRTFYALLAAFLFSATVTFAVPPSSPYAPGVTLDPQCTPGSANCSVSLASLAVGSAIAGATPSAVLFTDSSGNLSSNGTVAVAQGGTGATNMADARANLGLSYATNADITSLSTFTIEAWGDSLTEGVDTSPYPAQLATLSGYAVANNGSAGNTSTDIRNRFQAAPATYSHPTIIWSGRNNYSSPATVKSDIAAMVAALGHSNYIVLSILNSQSQIQGTSGYNDIIALNNDLATIYGSRYLDIRSYLVSQYNSGIPQDVTDNANDVPPSSLRIDSLHLNNAGNAVVAARIYQSINLLIPLAQRVITAANISPLFSSPPTIGNVTPNSGKFSSLIASGFTVSDTSSSSSSASLTVTSNHFSNIAIRSDQDGNSGNSDSTIRLYTDNAFVGEMGIDNSDGNSFKIMTGGSSGFSGSSGITISQTGAVGIGASSSGAKLHIAGSAQGAISYVMRLVNPFADVGTGTGIIFSINSNSSPVNMAAIYSANSASLNNGYIVFSTRLNGTLAEKMRITAEGNFGVGADSPNAKIESLATSEQLRLSYDATHYTSFVTASDGTMGVTRNGTAIATEGISFFSGGGDFVVNSNNTATPGLYVNQVSTGNIVSFADGGTSVFTILDGGNVGVRNTAPSVILHVGSASVTTGVTVARFENAGGTCNIVPSASGGVTCSSDMTLKKNIMRLGDSSPWNFNTNIASENQTVLAKILALVPVQYNWNVETDTDTKHAGFIAQEVQQVFPDLVAEDADTHLLSLNYSGLVPYTIQAIQEMNVTMQALPTFEDPTLAERVAVFLRGIAERGEAVINTVTAKKVKSDEISTDKLCVGATCVTQEQFLQIIQNSGQSYGAPEPQPAPDSTPAPDTNEDEEDVPQEDIESTVTTSDPAPDPGIADQSQE